MTHVMRTQRYMTCLWFVGLMGAMLAASTADAKSSEAQKSKTVNAIPCDYRAHPAITTVSPNHVKPGQKITISGKNFGTKHCFHSVSFGPKSTDTWTYVNSTMVEATVPNLRPGAVPVTVSTEAGSSQFTLEVQAK